jgi:chemotaxis protein CheX
MSMNVQFINPFLDAVINVLKVMAQTDATPGKPFLKKEKQGMGDVTGLIGMVGEKAKGSLAITFTEPAILHVTAAMLGEELSEVDETIADMVGEITNMVCGGAKRVLSERGYKFDLAVPSTIIGRGHSISHKTSGPVVVIPFEMEKGSFFVEVCFEE